MFYGIILYETIHSFSQIHITIQIVEQETKLELSCGNRYGLMGVNGCGKSCLLAVLGNREVPIQDHIDIFYLGKSCCCGHSNYVYLKISKAYKCRK